MSSTAKLKLSRKDCGTKIQLRMFRNDTACSDSSLKLETWKMRGYSSGMK